jgi:hypothetical protein
MAITCSACGRANDDDAGFCAGCGAELPRRCASCGAALAPGTVFCQACGALVSSSARSAGKASAPKPAPVPEETRIEPHTPRPGAGARPAAGAAAVGGGAASSAVPPPGPAQGPGPGVGYSVPAGPGQGPPSGPAQVPPVVPPSPTTPSSGGAGPRKGLPAWLLIVIIVAVIAAAAAAAVVVLLPKNEKEGVGSTASPSPYASHSPSRSASPTASPSSSPSPSPTAVAGFPMAAVTGPRGNVLSTIDAEGGVTPLGDQLGAQVYQVAWSPDGSRLACVAGAWDHARLWLADVGAKTISEVTIASPAVVAVDSVAWLSSTELLVAGFTAKPAFQGDDAEFVIYDVAAGAVSGRLEDGSGAPLRGVSVSSSADGARVAYVTYTDQKKNQYGMPTATERLELLDRSDGSVKELGSAKAFFDVNARRFDEPLISPDGQAVIFRAAGSDVGTAYTVVDANGAIIMHSKPMNFPAGYAWDPTSQKVVFTGHSVQGNGGPNDAVVFYVFDRAKGGRPKALVRYKATMVQDVSWSPDGSTIAFAEWRKSYRTGNIYQLSAKGGDAHRLASRALSPAYRPGP